MPGAPSPFDSRPRKGALSLGQVRRTCRGSIAAPLMIPSIRRVVSPSGLHGRGQAKSFILQKIYGLKPTRSGVSDGWRNDRAYGPHMGHHRHLQEATRNTLSGHIPQGWSQQYPPGRNGGHFARACRPHKAFRRTLVIATPHCRAAMSACQNK